MPTPPCRRRRPTPPRLGPQNEPWRFRLRGRSLSGGWLGRRLPTRPPRAPLAVTVSVSGVAVPVARGRLEDRRLLDALHRRRFDGLVGVSGVEELTRLRTHRNTGTRARSAHTAVRALSASSSPRPACARGQEYATRRHMCATRMAGPAYLRPGPRRQHWCGSARPPARRGPALRPAAPSAAAAPAPRAARTPGICAACARTAWTSSALPVRAGPGVAVRPSSVSARGAGRGARGRRANGACAGARADGAPLGVRRARRRCAKARQRTCQRPARAPGRPRRRRVPAACSCAASEQAREGETAGVCA
jgi:hypothetical protein